MKRRRASAKRKVVANDAKKTMTATTRTTAVRIIMDHADKEKSIIAKIPNTSASIAIADAMIVVLAAGAIVMQPIDPTAVVMRPMFAIVTEVIDRGKESKHEDVQVKLHRPYPYRFLRNYLLIPTMIIMDTIEELVLLRRLMVGDTEVCMILEVEGRLCHLLLLLLREVGEPVR